MKCLECGSMGFAASSCPDCGSDNIAEEAGANPTSTGTPQPQPQPEPAASPAMPEMPTADIAVGTEKPVVSTVNIPDTIPLPDGQLIQLRDGYELNITRCEKPEDAGLTREGTKIHLAVLTDDIGVSASTPVRIFARDGKTFVTGGGGNGFYVATRVKHKQDEEVELPRGVNIGVGIGRMTKKAEFPVK